MIDAEALGRMKPKSILINTCRGEVVDEVALTAVLRNGKILGAGLDTFAKEPTDRPTRSSVRCAASPETIRAALTGNYRPEHVFALRQALELYDVHHGTSKHHGSSNKGGLRACAAHIGPHGVARDRKPGRCVWLPSSSVYLADRTRALAVPCGREPSDRKNEAVLRPRPDTTKLAFHPILLHPAGTQSSRIRHDDRARDRRAVDASRPVPAAARPAAQEQPPLACSARSTREAEEASMVNVDDRRTRRPGMETPRLKMHVGDPDRLRRPRMAVPTRRLRRAGWVAALSVCILAIVLAAAGTGHADTTTWTVSGYTILVNGKPLPTIAFQ